MISEACCCAMDVTIYFDANCVSMGHWICTDNSDFGKYGIYGADADIARIPRAPASIFTSDSSMSNGINQTIAKTLTVSF